MAPPEHLPARIWAKIVAPSGALVTPEQRRLARLLATLTAASIPVMLLFSIILMLLEPDTFSAAFPLAGSVTLLVVFAYLASRTRRYRRGALLIVVAFFGAAVFSRHINPVFQTIGPFAAGLSFLFAAIFFSIDKTVAIAIANWIGLALVLALSPLQASVTESMAILLLVALMSGVLILWLRHQRRANLLNSVDRFQDVADNVPVLMWMSGPDNILDTYFNRSWLEFTGQPAGTELGNSWTQSLHPDDSERCLNAYRSAFTGREPFSIECRLRRADGEYRWIRADGVPHISPDGLFLGYAGGCVDIHAQKRAEQVLFHSEQQFRQLVETSPGALLLTDRQGKIILSNAQLERMFGYRRDELLGQPVEILLSGDLQTIHENHRAEFFHSPATRPMGTGRDLTGRRKDGSLFPLEVGLSYFEEQDSIMVLVADIADRKQAEASLRENRERLQALFDLSPIGISLVSPEHNVLDANPALQKILRMPEEHLYSGKHRSRRYVRADGTPMPREEFPSRRALTEQIIIKGVEVGILTEEGDIIWTSVSAAPTPDGTVVVMLVDITERKRFEEQLKESERFATSTIDALSAHLCVLDEHGVILQVNKGWRDFARANPPVIPNYGIGSNYLAVCDATDGPAAGKAKTFAGGVRAVIRGDTELFEMEYPCHAPSGEKRWFHARVTRFAGDGLIRAVVTHINVTELKLVEIALRESESFLGQLAANYPNSYLSVIEKDLTVSFASGQEFVKQNVDPASLVGLKLEDVFGEQASLVREHYLKAFQGEDASFELFINDEHQHHKAVPLADEQDTVSRIMAVVENITDRVQAERELERYREHLEELVNHRTAELQAANEQLVKLSKAKDEFVSNVSHELRTPLTSMMLRQYLMHSHPDELEEHLGVMERETKRLRRIIEDLLQFSRLDQNPTTLNLELIDLNQLIRRFVSDRIAIADEKRLKVTFENKIRNPEVYADEGLLEEVLGVLMTNATNYTPADGCIKVTTVRRKKEGQRWLGFAVTDTGPGIHPDDMQHLFERFFRGESAKLSGAAGTGLGLALAKEIVEQHGGLIEVESASVPGKGARFTVWLPDPSDAK